MSPIILFLSFSAFSLVSGAQVSYYPQRWDERAIYPIRSDNRYAQGFEDEEFADYEVDDVEGTDDEAIRDELLQMQELFPPEFAIEDDDNQVTNPNDYSDSVLKSKLKDLLKLYGELLPYITEKYKTTPELQAPARSGIQDVYDSYPVYKNINPTNLNPIANFLGVQWDNNGPKIGRKSLNPEIATGEWNYEPRNFKASIIIVEKFDTFKNTYPKTVEQS